MPLTRSMLAPRLAYLVGLAALGTACFDDPLEMSSATTTDATTSGDGDGDTSGDGDGDASGDGDGDTSGDGDGDTSGDGDGDTGGDGDGDSGDGDGDSGDGDGDGGDGDGEPPEPCSEGPYAVDYTGPVLLDAGGNPQGVIVADLDNDGNLDIVSSERDNRELRAFLGSGGGGFSPPQVTVLNPMLPEALYGGAIADGVFDLLVRGYSNNTYVYARVRGDGNGGFNDYESVQLDSPTIALASVTLDSTLDMITTNNEGVVVVPSSAGQESFASQPQDWIFTPQQDIGFGQVAVGLIDDDLEPDLVVATFGRARVASGDGQGGFEFGQQELTFFGPPSGITLGDVDGDENTDVILTTLGGGSDAAHLFFGFGNGGFENEIELSAPSGPRDVVAADIDKDGLDDLAMIGSGNMVVYLSNGDGSFSAPQQLGCGLNQRQVRLGDFNGDCVDDVVAVSSSAEQVCVMLSN